MTHIRTWLSVVAMTLLLAPFAVAQAPSPLVAVSADHRAAALLGLGRVARDRSDWTEAHARFVESARLRAFDSLLQEEHFWIAVHADRGTAMQLAHALASRGAASRDVLARWIQLADDEVTPTALLAIVDTAARAVPADAEWTRTRAAVALRAERGGDFETATRAWAGVPTAAREATADWQASFLRVSAARTTRASLVGDFDRFVRAHPDDVGMRVIAVEAWADTGQALRALETLAPLLGGNASPAHLRRGAELARQGGDAERARRLFERLHASGKARDQDLWALGMLLATAQDRAALRRLLLVLPGARQGCAERLVDVVTAAGDHALLADLLPSLDPSCSTYRRVAPLAATVRLAQGDAVEAERWLAPLAQASTLDEPSRLVLARALSARQAWPEVDHVLSAMVKGRDDAIAREAARVLAWAWQGQQRHRQAWQLALRLASPFADTTDAQAGWAGMALAAGDVPAALRLANAGLGSTRDLDARMIHALLAARDGRPSDVLRWLAPEHVTLRVPGHVALRLDAIEALEGSAAAARAALAYQGIVATDAGLLARRAAWTMTSGDTVAAAADAARVRSLDPAQGERLDIALLIARDDADLAWGRLSSADPVVVAQAPAAWARLKLDAALAAHRWASADALLSNRDLELDAAGRTLAVARLRLGRDGSLGHTTRTSLERLVAEGRHVRVAQLLLAGDEIAKGAFAAALSRLAIVEPAAQHPADVRAMAAEALLALGRAPEVLAMIAATDTEPLALQVTRARARIALGQGAAVRADLARIARATGRRDAYLAWAATLDTAEARVAALSEALARHPDDGSLRLRTADARRLAGDLDGARQDIRAVLKEAPASRDAWTVRVATEATARSSDLVQVLREGRRVLGGGAEVDLLLGDAVAQAPQVPDAAVDEVTRWTAALPASHGLRAARLDAALAVSAGRWPLAEDAINRIERLAPAGDVAVQRLRAQVTAWSGAHTAAVPLFAAYLERVPDDAAIWRQYARLLSWRDDREGAARAYTQAEGLTAVPGVAAEANTRLAILRRAWPEAAHAARAWRLVEPTTLDALVDLAHALEQAGDVSGAAQAYEELSRWPGLPDTVRHTLGAYGWRHSSRGTGQVEIEHAEGFGGQRLVERRETALLGDAAVTRRGNVRAFARLGQGRLDTGGNDQAFTQTQAGLRAWFGRGTIADARMGISRVNGADTLLVGARLAARLSRGVAVEAATSRAPFWENQATVSAGLHTWTSGVRLRLLGRGALEASAGVDLTRLSDGNGRRQVDVSVGRQVSRGRQQFELRASGFLFGFTEFRPTYFSPSAFGRVDVEVGVERWFGQGAAVRDGRFTLRGRAGTGVDTDGIPYWLGGGGVAVPIAGPLSVIGDGHWTMARTYQAWSATVGLQVGVTRGPEPASRTR